MDTRQWDVRQFDSSPQCKRSRGVESIPTEAFGAVNGYRHHSGDGGEPLDEPDWKRRRHSSQPNASVWDTSVQTSLWLAQQNRLAPIDSMSREENKQTCRTNESEQDDLLLNQAPNWSRQTEDTGSTQRQEERSLGAPDSVSGDPNPNKLIWSGSGPDNYTRSLNVLAPLEKLSAKAQQTGLEMHNTTAPQPRKLSTIAGFEQHCEKCSHSETLLRDVAASLSKLVDSLTCGPVAEVISQARSNGVVHEQTPYVSELHRVVDLLQEANELAKQIVREAPSYLQNVKKESFLQANDIQTSLETMKRRFLADSQDVLERQRRRSSDLNSNVEVQDYQSVLPDPSVRGGSPRRLSTAGTASNDVLPPIRSQSPSHPSVDGYGTRLPSMKPPPTPGRQLPSPPGRSHPSPPSYNIPSPSSVLYPQSVISVNAQPPQSSLSNILHPLSPTPSSSLDPSTAIQAHTAALQHEVSVKKYALQTLQSEHDKLLAALRRSQTRARALEEKQVASDLEINTLAEERVRLLTQAQELEQSNADVCKSREDFRQAAVKGGAQYVKIVRMASQLEVMAAEERREWRRKLDESKATIDALRGRQGTSQLPDTTSGEVREASSGQPNSEDDLKNELQCLRIRCAEMEMALKSVRSESHQVGEAITTLSTVRSRISESLGSVLIDPPPVVETCSLQPNRSPALPAPATTSPVISGEEG